MPTVALDLLGGDHAPESVVDGALLLVDREPDVEIVLVGPTATAQALLAERGASGRLRLVQASQVIGMDEEPARAVRAKRDATVRVAARLVRDGSADAVVSVGSTGAAMAAALFTVGRLKGVSRPALAAVIPSQAGPLVFLDAGASADATAAQLAQFALAGSALATVRYGIERPRVGLLSIGSEPGKGDELRKAAFALLSELPIDFVGNVEGHDVPFGGTVDVVVTDGFTGNVLAKGLEGAAAMLDAVLRSSLAGSPEALAALTEVTGTMSPEALGGGVLLGVNGVVVVGHGASSPEAVASCLSTAANAVREGLVPRIAAALLELLDRAAASAPPQAAAS